MRTGRGWSCIFLMALAFGVLEDAFSLSNVSGELISVANSGYRLLVDSAKGSITSLQSTCGIDHELLIPDHSLLPLFVIELMDVFSEFKSMSSSDAREMQLYIDGERKVQEFEARGILELDMLPRSLILIEMT